MSYLKAGFAYLLKFLVSFLFYACLGMGSVVIAVALMHRWLGATAAWLTLMALAGVLLVSLAFAGRHAHGSFMKRLPPRRRAIPTGVVYALACGAALAAPLALVSWPITYFDTVIQDTLSQPDASPR